MNILGSIVKCFSVSIMVLFLLLSCSTTDLSQEDTILLTNLKRLAPMSTFGVDLAYGSLSTETYSITFSIFKEPDIAELLLDKVLRNFGSQVVSRGIETDRMYIQAVIGSGAFDMNPALVKIEYVKTETGINCELISYAKEGLIKQKTAEKAARKVIAELSNQYVEDLE